MEGRGRGERKGVLTVEGRGEKVLTVEGSGEKVLTVEERGRGGERKSVDGGRERERGRKGEC